MASAAHPTVDTVVFDYGEVLSRPQPSWARAEMERLADVPATDFWSAYWAERPHLDAGATAEEFWERIAWRVGAAWNTRTAPGLVQALWAADVRSWLEVAPETAGIVSRLARHGVRLALLSNAPREIAGVLRASPVLAPFGELFFSCDLGACKPDPAVYTHVLTTLGTAPEDTVFVDDREENVVAAKRLGIDAHHFSDADDLESFLAQRFGAF